MATISTLRRTTWNLSNSLPAITESNLGLSSSSCAPLKTESLRAVTTRAASWIRQQYNYTHPPPRQYSTTVVDLAHRGLTLPYPSDAPVDTSLFEDEAKHTEYALVNSLPSLIRKEKYSTAARIRLRLAEQNIPIPQDAVYTKIAMRMLDPSSNPYGKVRINSFLIWWAMTPDRYAVPKASREAIATYIDNITTTLMNTPDDLQPLLRFTLLAARKGYGAQVIVRSIPHVVRWALPAISAKFLMDLTSALHGSRYSRRLQRSCYEQAIWGHIWAKRFGEAHLLFDERTRKAAPRETFCLKVLECLNRLEQKDWFDLWVRSIRAIHPATRLPLWREQDDPLSEEASQSLVDTFKHFRRNIHKRRPPPSRELALFMHEYLSNRPDGRALSLLHCRLTKRHEVYENSEIRRNGALGTQQGYWAAAEMIYHIRYRKDPIAALRIFNSYCLSDNIVSSELQHLLSSVIRSSSQKVAQTTSPTEGILSNKAGLGGQNLLNEVQTKLWPSNMILPLFWEAAIGSRVELGLSLEGVYHYFIQSLQHPLHDLERENMTHRSPTMRELRKLHSKNPYSHRYAASSESSPRYNIHTPTHAPIYRPHAALFNTFLTAAMRNTSMTPDDRSAMAFRIFEDMKGWGVTPTITSWSLIANVASRAGQWHQVLRLLEMLRAGGLMGQGWRASRPKRRRSPVLAAEAHSDSFLQLSEETVRSGVGSSLEVVYGGIIRGLTESRMLEEAKRVESLLASDGYIPGSNRILDEVLDILRSREAQKRVSQYRQ